MRERVGEGGGTGEPIRRQLLERHEYRRLNVGRHCVTLGDESPRRLGHHLRHDRLCRRPCEWGFADQHLVQHRA